MYIKKVFSDFIFGNYFIALCSLAMIFTTLLLCDLPLRFTNATVFVTTSTFLLYNFHKHSFFIDYSSIGSIIGTAKKIRLKTSEIVAYTIAIIVTAVFFFRLHKNIYPYLVPLALLAIAYSAPLIRNKGKMVRLKEVFFIKTPLIALVWALTTTVIPLVEQNFSIVSTFMIWQVISRTLFIFALCIPFEMRDMDVDRKNNISTIAVTHGKKFTQVAGIIIILIEILTHHFMPGITAGAMLALDLSSAIALLLILFQNNKRSGYYYKFMVDGTMVLRFLFLCILSNAL